MSKVKSIFGAVAGAIASQAKTITVWVVIVLVIYVGIKINAAQRAQSVARLSSTDTAVQDAEIMQSARQMRLADALADIQDPNSVPTSDTNVADTKIRVACATEFTKLVTANKPPNNLTPDQIFGNLYDLHKDGALKPVVTAELATLGQQNDNNLDRLVKNLGDGDPDVRGASGDALAVIGALPAPIGAQTIQKLVDAVAVAGQKADALTTLGKIGKPAAPKLVEMMATANPDFTQTLINMLATIGDPSSMPAIEQEATATPPDPATRRVALLGISTIVLAAIPASQPPAAPPAATTPVAAPLPAAAPTAAKPVPAATTSAGAAAPTAPAAKAPAAKVAAPAPIAAPAAPKASVAASATAAKKPAAPAPAPVAPAAAPAPPPGPSPQDIANCMSAAPILTGALNNPGDDSRARAQCALAVGRLATPACIAALVKALGDIDTRISVAATNGLASVGPPAVAALAAAVHSPSESVRIGAASALGSIGTDAAVSAMASTLSDPSPNVRRSACEALGRSASATAVPLLAARLSDSDGFVAGAASSSLQALGKPAVPALVAALGGANQTTAFYAAQALAGMGLDAAPQVRAAAQSGSPTVKLWGAVVLGQMRDNDSRTLLESLAADSDPKIKFAASQALEELGGSAA